MNKRMDQLATVVLANYDARVRFEPRAARGNAKHALTLLTRPALHVRSVAFPQRREDLKNTRPIMFVSPKTVQTNDTRLIHDNRCKRKVPLFVPDAVVFGHLPHRRSDHEEGNPQFQLCPFNVARVSADAQGYNFAAGFADFIDSSLQLTELLSAWHSPIRVIEEQDNRALAAKGIETKYLPGYILNSEVRPLLLEGSRR